MSTKIRASFECPLCGKNCFFDLEDANSNFSTNCVHCGELLLANDGEVYPFHQKLHEEDPRWPADGKGTGCLTMPRQNPEGS